MSSGISMSAAARNQPVRSRREDVVCDAAIQRTIFRHIVGCITRVDNYPSKLGNQRGRADCTELVFDAAWIRL